MKKAVEQPNSWAEKLAQLPLKGDVNQSWAQMEQLLDQHLPLDQPDGVGPNSPQASYLFTLLKYILPILATVALLTYFLSRPGHQVKLKKQQQEQKRSQKEERDTLNDEDKEPLLLITKKKPESLAPKQLMAVPDPITSGLEAPNTSALEIKDNVILGKVSVAVPLLVMDTMYRLRELLPTQKLKMQIAPPIIASSQKNKIKKKRLKKEKNWKLKAWPSPTKSATKNGGYRPKEERIPLVTPHYSLQAQLGLANWGKVGPYIGLEGSYAFNKYLLLNAGLVWHGGKQLGGSFTHEGYNRFEPSVLTIIDERKLNTLDIPVYLGYRLQKYVSLKAGSWLSLGLSQSGGARLGKVTNYLDTVFHSQEINRILENTTFNRIKFGYAAGIELQFNKIGVQGLYMRQLKPYAVKNNFGGYQQSYRAFTIGVSYRLGRSAKVR